MFYSPHIAPNTGNAIRMVAATGCELHLVEPMGFDLSEPKLRRAGLDYHEWAEVRLHRDLAAYRAEVAPARLFAFSTRGTCFYHRVTYQPGDALLFGPETRGLPASVLDALPAGHCLRVPMRPNSRSLNLANTVALVVYEAWRQCGFAGATPALDS